MTTNRSRQELLMEIARLAKQVTQLERDSIDEHSRRIVAEEHAERGSLELAMTVHELRTPLTSIVGYASTILATDVAFNAKEIDGFVTIIAEEAEKMRFLLDELLIVARSRLHTSTIKPAPVSLTDILTLARTHLGVVAPHHRLSATFPENLPLALADRQRIAQVLVNLVKNAAEHAPLETTIQIAATTETQEMIRVDVSDEGLGIPSDLRDSIFNAFKRGADDADETGTNLGLGLAICKAIIEAHGGSIWVEDGPVTRLSFTLPVAQQSNLLPGMEDTSAKLIHGST